VASDDPRSQQYADADLLAEHLNHTGLPPRALKEVCQVANPDLRPALGRTEFRACCRLVAHCQDLLGAGDAVTVKVLKKGAGPLRALLRARCLAIPPPALPRF